MIAHVHICLWQNLHNLRSNSSPVQEETPRTLLTAQDTAVDSYFTLHHYRYNYAYMPTVTVIQYYGRCGVLKRFTDNIHICDKLLNFYRSDSESTCMPRKAGDSCQTCFFPPPAKEEYG